MLAQALENENIRAVYFNPEHHRYANISQAAGLIVMAPIEPLHAFRITRHCAGLLMAEANPGKAFFITVTSLDGSFGFSGKKFNNPVQGSLAGLLKTAAREWPDVRCLALDIDPAWKDSEKMVKAIVNQILYCSGPSGVEIGLGPEGRSRLVMESSVFPQGRVELNSGDVVVITGGARGITARAAVTLAVECKPSIALLGRSEEPFQEPSWLAGLSQPAQIKQAIMEHEFKNRKVVPRQLEKVYQRYIANREILDTLASIEKTGARVRYFSADIRQADQVADIMDRVRRSWGPVTALIHGAGVLADKQIADKSDEQFEMVFSTKVDGWYSLIDACKDDPLRNVVIFSSVTARTGNPGQADYAMANEALNKLAGSWAIQHPECKVSSINWGPWDGGMVDEALRRNFQRQAVELIPMEAGARAMLMEMAGPLDGPVETVVGSVFEIPDQQPARSAPKSNKDNMLNLAFEQQISLQSHPVLDSHRLNGKPVVPMALITELLGHAALHANPGLNLVGLDQVRLMKGIVLENNLSEIKLMTGKAQYCESAFVVPVEIHNGTKERTPVIHCRAKAILAEDLPPSPDFDQDHLLEPTPDILEAGQAYDRMLFHGPAFHGIKRLIRVDDNGLTALLKLAPPPKDWLREPLRGHWIADPLVLDCAFQMAIIWSRTICGKPSLPSYIDSYRQYTSSFPAQGVTAVMQVSENGENKLVSSFVLLDDQRKIVARMDGYEAIMDPNLERAFNAN